MAQHARKKKSRSKKRTVRLLPVTITMLSLLLVIKINEVYLGSQRLREMYDVRSASAEDEKAKEEKSTTPAATPDAPAADGAKSTKPIDALVTDDVPEVSEPAPKPADAVKEPTTKPTEEKDEKKKDEEKKAEGGAHGKSSEGKDAKDHKDDKEGEKDAKKEDKEKSDKKDEKKDDKKEDGHGKEEKHGEGEGEAKPEEEPKTFGTGKSTIKEIEALKARDAQPRFSKTEIDLLENLSKRRDELDQREKEMEMKARVLDATEKRINDKLGEMKNLQTELTKIVAQYNDKQDTQIKSLVKIYEGMKPDEAAAIFNELEMPILLDVISKMSERKVSPILANMTPKKAKDVTQELAEKRKKDNIRISGSAPLASLPAAAVTPAPAKQ